MIKKLIDKVILKIGIFVAKKISPVIREALDNPGNLEFTGKIEGEEIVIRVKVKDKNRSTTKS